MGDRISDNRTVSGGTSHDGLGLGDI
jgi:hypothetical protein